MWKQALPLMLLLFVSIGQAQSNQTQTNESQSNQAQPKPVVSETHPGQRRVGVMQVVASEIAPPVTWADPHQKLERAALVNAMMERQIALRRDTEKLLFLAEELKQNVDKTGPNILSIDVIKKAQEIEKLAKSVKDKMKNPY